METYFSLFPPLSTPKVRYVTHKTVIQGSERQRGGGRNLRTRDGMEISPWTFFLPHITQTECWGCGWPRDADRHGSKLQQKSALSNQRIRIGAASWENCYTITVPLQAHLQKNLQTSTLPRLWGSTNPRLGCQRGHAGDPCLWSPPSGNTRHTFHPAPRCQWRPRAFLLLLPSQKPELSPAQQ